MPPCSWPGRLFAALIVVCIAWPAGAGGRLVIGLAADVTSIDPHFHNTSSNNAVSRHIFETLVGQVRFLLDKRVGDAVTFAFTTGAVRTA
jgi:hypothetical protein